MKRSKRATNSLNDDQMEELTSWNSYFSREKAYLKANALVKTPLHEFMAVERSGLWAPGIYQSTTWPGRHIGRIMNHNIPIQSKIVQELFVEV